MTVSASAPPMVFPRIRYLLSAVARSLCRSIISPVSKTRSKSYTVRSSASNSSSACSVTTYRRSSTKRRNRDRARANMSTSTPRFPFPRNSPATTENYTRRRAGGNNFSRGHSGPVLSGRKAKDGRVTSVGGWKGCCGEVINYKKPSLRPDSPEVGASAFAPRSTDGPAFAKRLRLGKQDGGQARKDQPSRGAMADRRKGGIPANQRAPERSHVPLQQRKPTEYFRHRRIRQRR